MPRIPDEELERIKREVDLAALVRSKGIELKAHGAKDLAGLSPFTDEKTPSFIVTPGKNLWHCMSSGKGGSVIDFIMAHDGVSFREAAELLRTKHPSLYKSGSPVKKSTVPKLPPPVEYDADDQTLLAQVLDYYQERLQENPAALDYLEKRGLGNAEALRASGVGFADRTLGLRLPQKNRKDGQTIRERLTRLGIYRESGHEHLNGCVVFPVRDLEGKVTEIYGRKVGPQKSGIYHLYLPGPHRGLWNPQCLQSPEIILCESIIDAFTFWVNGMKNVTCIYGTEGWTGDHLDAFKSNQTQRVYLAYDRDKAGDRAAARDAELLQSHGIECFRVQFPPGMDANEYSLKVTPASKSLSVLLNAAQWLGKGQPSPVIKDTAVSLDKEIAANVSSSEVSDASEKAQSVPEKATKEKSAPALEQRGDDLLLTLGEREYRVRGLAKNASFEVLKVNVRLWCQERFYLDTFDFYRAKERASFTAAAATETNLEPDLIKRDLGKLLLALEAHQEARLREALEPKPVEVAIAENERQAALELLQSPRLLERILEDFEKCGIVGEATNKLAGYVACVSRKLDKPLAVIIQSTSAAGKSTLMEAVLSFLPPEEQIKYSAMTGQSLYYLGESNLKHKILAIVEEEGAERASYALKLLQSEGELTIASTGKDPSTGRMQTEEYHVEGPVMIFLTTTAIEIDEELLNRCLVLTVDESRAQTEAIHRLQRESETFNGLRRKVERERILAVHRNAQRLLKPLHVVNPYAPQLTFLSHSTRTRRDHMKYLTLIKSIALLHQHQRPLKEREGIQFIEVEKADIEAAGRIALDVLSRSLDELPPQTRRLLGIVAAWVKEQCESKALEREEVVFTRRQVREVSGWSNSQVKVHLDRLEEMEYLCRHRGSFGVAYEYELACDPDAPNLPVVGLADVEKLSYDAHLADSKAGLTAPCGTPPRKAEPNHEAA